MDGFFRAVAIGLGVLMGTLNPGIEPQPRFAAHKTTTELVVSGEVDRALSPAMEEALREGVEMRLTMTPSVNGKPGAAVQHTLAYRALDRVWTVANGATREYRLLTEAQGAWSSWTDAPAGLLPTGAFTVTVAVGLTFPNRQDWKSDLVWKVPAVEWERSYLQASEVPY